jgi:hypothetical protein
MDADCVVTSPWLLKIVAEFLDHGPIFCAEGILPASDVRHAIWARAFQELGFHGPEKPSSSCIPYLNSGFFGLRLPRDEIYLDLWNKLIDRALLDEGDFFNTPYYPTADQDCLNAVVTNLGRQYFTLGAPDIWYKTVPASPFTAIGVSTTPLFLHCTGMQKPWRLKVPPLSRPDDYDRLFFRFAYQETPLVSLSEPLPRRISTWIEDGLSSRVNLRFRKGTARVTGLVQRGTRHLLQRGANS